MRNSSRVKELQAAAARYNRDPAHATEMDSAAGIIDKIEDSSEALYLWRLFRDLQRRVAAAQMTAKAAEIRGNRTGSKETLLQRLAAADGKLQEIHKKEDSVIQDEQARQEMNRTPFQVTYYGGPPWPQVAIEIPGMRIEMTMLETSDLADFEKAFEMVKERLFNQLPVGDKECEEAEELVTDP